MQRRARRSAQCEAEKGRASQKQRSEFLAAPVHMAPPGRQKSERAFCLFGGVFLRPARRAIIWPFLRGQPLLCGLLRPVFRHFSAGVPLPCSRPAAVRRFLSGLRCLLAVCPPSPLFPACRPPAAFVLGPRRRGLLAVCLPCALFWLFVHLSVLFARVFSLVFHPFLPNFFLSNFFSFVAQAATGLYFLPKRK